MPITHDNYRQLLWQYRQQRESGGCSPLTFLSDLDVPNALQMEVIAIDWELALKEGFRPELDRYIDDFPYLEDRLRLMLPGMVSDFVDKFRPIERLLFEEAGKIGFQIEDELSRGGMGVVFRATQKATQKEVALKFLFFSRMDIYSEAKFLRRIHHPCVCRAVDVGNLEDYPYLAMSLAEGSGLNTLMESRHFDMPGILGVVSSLADALRTVHESGIVHLDVKPRNIIVDENDCPTLIDFGLARNCFEIWGSLDESRIASPSYCSPEQLDPQFGDIDYRSDIYSLGLILYEMITGRRLHATKGKRLIDQLQNDPPRRPSDYCRSVSPQFEKVVLKAIKTRPEHRYSSMAEFQQALRELVESEVAFSRPT